MKERKARRRRRRSIAEREKAKKKRQKGTCPKLEKGRRWRDRERPIGFHRFL